MLNRRKFLTSTSRGATAAGIAISGAALWSTSHARADPAVTKDQAGYKDSPNGSQSCAACKNFKPPSACNIVSGQVNPQGWCRLFAQR